MKKFLLIILSCLSINIPANCSVNKDLLTSMDLTINQLCTFIDDSRYVDYFFNDVAIMYLEISVEYCEKNEPEKAIKYINKSKDIMMTVNMPKLRR